MNLKEWLNANYITLISIILSGIISLIISNYYYNKGNRNNLKLAVIHPMIRILEDGYSRNNYDKLCEIAKGYSTRYLKKSEAKKLNNLLLAYKEASKYSDIEVNADILFSFFEDKLRKNQIDTKPFPVEYQGEIVDNDYPPNLLYLSLDLENVLKKYDPYFEPDKCEDMVNSLYKKYCKEYYNSDKIEFFNDCTLEGVLEKSNFRAKWNEKYNAVEEAKEQFIKLSIAR